LTHSLENYGKLNFCTNLCTSLVTPAEDIGFDVATDWKVYGCGVINYKYREAIVTGVDARIWYDLELIAINI